MSKDSSTAPLQITPVTDKAGLDRFIHTADAILGNDPAWVQPLTLERRMQFSPRSNPYFKHARWQAWVASRNGRSVGRITAQIDELHTERYHDATGFFGVLDAEDNRETFAALLNTAEAWLRDKGMTHVRGPLSLSINEEVGLLVDGFDTPPVFMMGHALPYYGAHIEACGYTKAKDMLAYTVAPTFTIPPVMRRLLESSGQKVRVRQIDRKRFKAEVEVLRDIFNDAWADNWGFVPFTEAEFDELGRSLRMLISLELIQIAEVDGEPAAFIVALPNINAAIAGLHGKLLPLGWAKLLWRLKVRFPHTARVCLMGVRRKFHYSRLGPALAFAVIDAVREPLIKRHVEAVELSWILEDNDGMRNILETMGSRVYKRYRVYERDLA